MKTVRCSDHTLFFLLFAAQNGFITYNQIEDIYESYQENQDLDFFSAVKTCMSEKEIAVVETLVRNLDMDNISKGDEEMYSMLSDSLSDGVAISTIQNVEDEQHGHYAIVGESGRGGMGRVMIAFDRHIGREVALKELFTMKFSDDDPDKTIDILTSRFLREARITGRLEHPAIIPVHEIGKRKDGTLFYSMKLVKGKTLSQAISECQSLEDALMLLPHFRDLCHAVSYAHSKGIIHRDIKPDNVMIGEFGETVVLDWGLAKSIYSADQVSEFQRDLLLEEIEGAKTVAGRAIGTPAYMSPEQALGEIENIDELSDIYSLGAVFYEIVTGHSPFDGKNAYELIAKVIHEPFIPFDKEGRPPPIELQAIASKAMSKKKEDRYQHVKELVHDVEAYMAGERVSAHQYKTGELLNLFIKQHKALVSTVVIVFMVLVVSVILIYNQYVQSQKSFKNEQLARVNEREATLRSNYYYSQALLKEAKDAFSRHAYNAASIYAASSLIYNPSEKKSEFYDKTFETTYPESNSFKVEAYSLLYQKHFITGVNLESMLPHSNMVPSAAFSPSGNILATACWDGRIKLWRLKDNKIVSTFHGHSDVVNRVVYSENGKLIVSASNDKTVKIWRVATGEAIQTLIGHLGNVRSVDISPDSRMVVSGSKDKTVKLWDIYSGKLIRTIRGHDELISAVRFTTDGQYIVTASYDKMIKIWDAKTGKQIRSIKAHDKIIYDIEISPDGQTVASTSLDHTIKLWNIKSGELIRTFTGHKHIVYTVDFSFDGKWLSSGSLDQSIKIWNVATGEIEYSIEGHADGILQVLFSPEGRRLISAGGDRVVKVWSIQKNKASKTFNDNKNSILSIAFSPDNKTVAAGDVGRRIVLWNYKTGERNLSIQDRNSGISALIFSKKGKKMITGDYKDTIKVWDVESGKELRKVKAHTGVVMAVSVSPDNKTIASASKDRLVKLLDLESLELKQTLKGHTDAVYDVVFSPDNKYVFSGSFDFSVKVWDAATGKELHSLKHPDYVSSVALSDDGKYIYSACKDANIYKWDWKKETIVMTYIGHDAWVNVVRLSPDSRYVLSSADDRTVRVWDEKTGNQLLIFNPGEPLATDWSYNGTFLAYGNSTRLELWPFKNELLQRDPQQLLKKAEVGAGKYLDGFQLKQMNVEQLKKRKNIEK